MCCKCLLNYKRDCLVFDVFSVKRMYNIKVSTGKNTWFLVKIDDDDDELGFSFLNIMSLVQPLSSASSVVLLKLSALIMAPPGQTGRQRQCVLNLFDSLSVHPSVTKLVKTIFWKWLNWFDVNWQKWSTLLCGAAFPIIVMDLCTKVISLYVDLWRLGALWHSMEQTENTDSH